jgi:fimbrial isopeptide formation D2 family protein
MHPDRPDDLLVLMYNLRMNKRVEPVSDVPLGSVVTYTVTLSNPNATDVPLVFTDTLPAAVTFGGWTERPEGAEEAEGTITWTGTVAGNGQVTLGFTATLNGDYNLYGQTVTNTARFASDNAGSGQASATFTVIGAPSLSIAKSVSPQADVPPGGVVTYTVVLCQQRGRGGAHRGVVPARNCGGPVVRGRGGQRRPPGRAPVPASGPGGH